MKDLKMPFAMAAAVTAILVGPSAAFGALDPKMALIAAIYTFAGAALAAAFAPEFTRKP